MRKLIIIGLLCTASTSQAAFSYRRTLTVDHTKVQSTDQTNFAILIATTVTTFKYTGSGGNVQNANGYDIVPYSNSDCVTGKYDFEIDSYTAQTGRFVAWVRIPTLHTGSDDLVYLCYGDASISTSQENINGTWNSAYVGIYHFGNGITLTATDSTSNGNNGTLVNTPVAGTGQIAGAADLERDSSQQITAGTGSSLELQDFTVSAWIKGETFSGISTDIIFSKMGNVSTGGYELGYRSFSDLKLAAAYYDGTIRGWFLGTAALSAGTWYHVVFVRDKTAGNIIFYINGSSDGTATATTGTITYVGDTARIGAQPQNTLWDGLIDELEVSNSIRSADWIKTEYNNQFSPDTFYSVGAETSVGATTPVCPPPFCGIIQ
jgi:biopolymer transport protein ExbB